MRQNVKRILVVIAIIFSLKIPAGGPHVTCLQGENNAAVGFFPLSNLSSPSSEKVKVGRPAPPLRGGRPPDWLDELIEKIWLKESSGRLKPPDGDGGAAVGPLQIHKKAIDDVNKFYGTKYTLDDVRQIAPAKEVARLYVTLWLEKHKEEIAARIYNGGPRGWRKKSTDEYWEDVKKLMIDY